MTPTEAIGIAFVVFTSSLGTIAILWLAYLKLREILKGLEPPPDPFASKVIVSARLAEIRKEGRP